MSNHVFLTQRTTFVRDLNPGDIFTRAAPVSDKYYMMIKSPKDTLENCVDLSTGELKHILEIVKVRREITVQLIKSYVGV